MLKRTQITGLILLGLLTVLANGFLGQHPELFQWDMTDEKIHTISQGTRDILSEIEEPIELRFYFSDNLSQGVPQIRQYAQRVKNLLTRYANLSDSKVRLTILNPEPFSEAEAAAIRVGLNSVPLSASGDRLYFGLVGINSVDKEVIIPFFQSEREALLEYDLSKMIAALNQTENHTIGVISSLKVLPKAGFARSDESNVIFDQAKELFTIRELSSDLTEIDPSIDLLVLIQPPELDIQTLYAIDQFTMKGGKILAFVDPFAEALPGNSLQFTNYLGGLLNQWGVELARDKILADADNALAIRLTPAGGPVRHPSVLGYSGDHFEASHPVVSQLERLNFSIPGVLAPTSESSTLFEPLVVSSNNTSLIDLQTYRELESPSEMINFFTETQQVYPLIASVSGDIQSLFPDGPPKSITLPATHRHLSKSDSEFRAIVVADVDFLTDRLWVTVQNFLGQSVLSPFANNGDFVVNAMDTLLGNSALMTIRNRGITQRPFSKIEHIRRNAEAAYREKEKELKQQLEETETKLTNLQSARGVTGVVSFTEEQKETLAAFIQEKSDITNALREVRHQLNREIEGLGTRLKILNILFVPILVTLIAFILLIVKLQQRSRHLRRLQERSHG